LVKFGFDKIEALSNINNQPWVIFYPSLVMAAQLAFGTKTC